MKEGRKEGGDSYHYITRQPRPDPRARAVVSCAYQSRSLPPLFSSRVSPVCDQPGTIAISRLGASAWKVIGTAHELFLKNDETDVDRRCSQPRLPLNKTLIRSHLPSPSIVSPDYE